MSHNPEVAGSNPAPATKVGTRIRTRIRVLFCQLCTGFVHELPTGRKNLAVREQVFRGGTRSLPRSCRPLGGGLAPSLGAKPEIPVGPPSVAQCKLQSPLGDRRRLRGGLESQGRLRRPGFEGGAVLGQMHRFGQVASFRVC